MRCNHSWVITTREINNEPTCTIMLSVCEINEVLFDTTVWWRPITVAPRSVMNCLRSLESWDRGFESRSRDGCLCVRLFCVRVVLWVGSDVATGWCPVQKSYRLFKKDYETEEARAQQRAVRPLMNKWMYDEDVTFLLKHTRIPK
jgi:hypothetical protein